MAILDVGLLTGFSLAQNGVQLNDLVRRVETPSGRVTLYLDTVSSSFMFMTTVYSINVLSLFLCWWWFIWFMFFCALCIHGWLYVQSHRLSLIRWTTMERCVEYPPSWTLRWSMSKMLWSWSTITMSPVRLLNNSSRFSNRMHSYVAVCVSSSLFIPLSSAGRRTVRSYTSETRRDMSVCHCVGRIAPSVGFETSGRLTGRRPLTNIHFWL